MLVGHVRPVHQCIGMRKIRVKPGVVQFGRNDDGSTLFTGLVKLTHHWVLIGIDREHRKAHHQLTRGRIFPTIPQTRNAKRLAAGQLYLPSHCLTGVVAGFIEVIYKNKTKLTLTPRGSIARLFSCCFATRVVGMTTDLLVFCPSRNQTESGKSASHTASLVTFNHNWCSESRICLNGETCWKVNTELLLNPRSLLGWREVCTHAGSL